MKTQTTLAIAILGFTIALAGFASHADALPCVVPNAGGTAQLPPIGCAYTAAPGDSMQILPPAIPAGNTIDMDPELGEFFGVVRVPGGALGGEAETYNAILSLEISGTGGIFAGFNRSIFMQVAVETHSGPRSPGDAVQSFPTDMFSLQGSIFGDPDFDFLTITGGTNFGLPSPGHTILTRLGPPGSDFQVDSFFDVAYTIDFQGAPGSILDGMGGRTTGTVRLEMGDPIPEPASLSLLAVGALAIVRRRRKA